MNRTYVFNRMPRLRVPLPADEIKIPSPPAVSSPPRLFWYQALLPLAGILLMAGVMLAIYANPLMLLPMLVMSATTTLTSLLVRKAQQRQHKQSLQEAEQAYARVLEQKRAELERLRQEQQRLLHETDPALETLLERTRQRSPRLWERQPEDGDFLRLRLGIGTRRSNVTVVAPHPDMPDPRLETAHALEAEYAWLPQVPLAADLRGGPLGIAGPAPARFDIARALLCQLATHHAPDCVSLWAVVTPERAEEWAWIRWLPHSRDERGDMLLAADPAAADALLNDLLERLRERQNDLSSPSPLTLPSGWLWLVLLLDTPPALLAHPAVHLLLSPVGRRLNATALFVVEQPVDVPTGCRAIAALQPDGQLKHAATGEAGEARCWPDRADAPFCDALARSLAPLQIQTPQADQALPTQVRLLDLLGIEDIDRYDAAARWRERASVARLQVPIGVRRGGRPLLLDLHATAHGPHGLVAGTTGSGKSELLQTMVVGLALTHHPHDVAFVLVDFKGGGAFGGLADLPHVLGVVTDLSGRLAERALVALEAEMDRRKRCFQEAGVSDIDQYQRLYWQDALAVPLPRLVVIVDEFAELARDHPDFIDGLVGVARVGRSLGLHLILATQSPAGVVRQQIWANARFRICLRVETRQESQEMLHRPDAVSLPRIPGRGYLQVGNDDVFELFQVARVAGPYPGSRKQEVEQEERLVIRAVSPLGQRTVLFDAGRPPRAQGALCDLDVALRRMVQAAAEMGIEKLDSPWPAPLPERLVLADLLTGPSWDGQRWRECPPGLAAVLGLLDEPERQRQSVWQLPLAEQDGHALLIGAPGSGKSLWLRTLVVSLALNWPPDRLHVYLIELGGQALRVFEGLPHLGALLGPADGERVQRLLLRLLDELEERRRLCEQKGVEGVAALRARWPDAAPPAILLVIAGLAEFRTLFADEMNWLLRLLREGGACGIHVVLAGDRAGDVPATVSSLVARRVALRLAEADEYGLVLGARLRPASDQRLPPGRGWYGRPPLEFQAAAPVRAADEAAQGVELRRLVQAMDAAGQGARPAPVALRPWPCRWAWRRSGCCRSGSTWTATVRTGSSPPRRSAAKPPSCGAGFWRWRRPTALSRYSLRSSRVDATAWRRWPLCRTWPLSAARRTAGARCGLFWRRRGSGARPARRHCRAWSWRSTTMSCCSMRWPQTARCRRDWCPWPAVGVNWASISSSLARCRTWVARRTGTHWPNRCAWSGRAFCCACWTGASRTRWACASRRQGNGGRWQAVAGSCATVEASRCRWPRRGRRRRSLPGRRRSAAVGAEQTRWRRQSHRHRDRRGGNRDNHQAPGISAFGCLRVRASAYQITLWSVASKTLAMRRISPLRLASSSRSRACICGTC
jgi:S-DNA-T family DNA segregation ATPase FtsK/SpoIIIE